MTPRRILVAADGTSGSRGALRVARDLALAPDTGVEVLTVVEPLPVFDTGFMVALPEADLVASRRTNLEGRVREALAEIGEPEWPIRVRTGSAAPGIADEATERSPDLVVTGLGHHRALDRLFGTETVLRLLHLLHVPLLAVPEDTTGLPGSAVIALDFSSFGYRAARAARAVLSPEAAVHLVHVLSGADQVPETGGAWRGRYEAEVKTRLEAQGRELGFRPERTRVHLREGDPAEELLALGREVGDPLLVAGTHGHSFVGRMLLGSVSTRLVRGATGPLLIVPPPAEVPTETRGGSASEEVRRGWRDELAAFSRRHQGSRVDVEVHAPAWGFQQTGRCVQLLGVDLDVRADRVELMLGDPGASRCHFTHVVPSPVHVEIVADVEGRERGLLVEGRQTRMSVTLSACDED